MRRTILSGHTTRLSRELDFLHGSFVPHAYYWEVVDTVRKLLLVGFATFVRPGSILQLVYAISLSLVFFAWHIQVQPYRDRFDDVAGSGMLLATISIFLSSNPLVSSKSQSE